MCVEKLWLIIQVCCWIIKIQVLIMEMWNNIFLDDDALDSFMAKWCKATKNDPVEEVQFSTIPGVQPTYFRNHWKKCCHGGIDVDVLALLAKCLQNACILFCCDMENPGLHSASVHQHMVDNFEPDFHRCASTWQIPSFVLCSHPTWLDE